MSKALKKAHIEALIENIYKKIDQNSIGLTYHEALENKTNIRYMTTVHNLQKEIKEL